MTVKAPSSRTRLYLAVAALLAALTACSPPSSTTQSAAGPTTADALAFLDEVEREFDGIGEEAARINWVNATYINYDTD